MWKEWDRLHVQILHQSLRFSCLHKGSKFKLGVPQNKFWGIHKKHGEEYTKHGMVMSHIFFPNSNLHLNFQKQVEALRSHFENWTKSQYWLINTTTWLFSTVPQNVGIWNIEQSQLNRPNLLFMKDWLLKAKPVKLNWTKLWFELSHQRGKLLYLSL